MRRHLPRHVSVVIPVLNGLPYLAEQLDALSAQDYDGSWDVVISDNGSSDGLLTFLEDYSAQTNLTIKYVDASQRRGAAHARNIGYRASTGEFVGVVDSDDRVRPSWLSSLLKIAETADLVSGSLETRALNSTRVSEWRPVPAPGDGWQVEGWYATAPGGNLGVWRDVHEAVGGFDESLVHTYEDADYVWRAQLAGFKMTHCEAAIIDVRLRSNLRSFWKQMYWAGRGAVTMHARYRDRGFDVYNRPLLLPFVIISLLVRNPLLPKSLTKMSTGRWIYFAAHEMGKIHGSVVERVLCV